MYVEIVGWTRTLGRVELRDGVAVADGDAAGLLSSMTIVEPGTVRILRLSDGERYLRALPYNLAGTRIQAVLHE